MIRIDQLVWISALLYHVKIFFISITMAAVSISYTVKGYTMEPANTS